MGESAILTRIWEELKALRDDLRANDAKHSELSAKVIALQEDRMLRDRSRTTWITVGCSFGGLGLMAIAALVSMVLSLQSTVAQMDKFGTSYGRGQGDLINTRLDKESRRNDAQDIQLADKRGP